MQKNTPQHGVKSKINIQGEGPANDGSSGFEFGRMIHPSVAPAMTLKLSTAATLGARMTSRPEAARADSDVPAGYTYFGQFVDHDITSDMTDEATEGDDASTDQIEPTDDGLLEQGRSPSLDLDSLYGALSGVRPEFVNGSRFHIGKTSPVGGVGASDKPLDSDLPRGKERNAIIGDDRNDENLAVAQTHLLFLHFHNAVAAELEAANPGSAPGTIVEQARDLVTRHYQHVVLHDYLPRIIDAAVHEDIIVKGNRKTLSQGPGELAFMPLEFSVAAFRLGHSQVRQTYEWNANFGTNDQAGQGAPTNFRNLFTFSGLSGNLGGLPTLPTNWVADFRRMFDLSGRDFPHLADSVTGPMNVTKALDAYIAPVLGALPGRAAPMNNLAVLNLRRGAMRSLPSGQDVSRALPSVKMLTKTQMKEVLDPDFDAEMERLGLYERTPLWLYILLEAAAVGKGMRLGQLGSTIVADTFRTLVLTSRSSILAPNGQWEPAQAQAVLGAAAPLSTLADIIAWTDKRFAVVDPVQDARNA